MSGVEKYLKEILGESKEFARKELCNLVKEAKSDSESFIRKQGERLEKYLKKLAEGKITKAEFKSLVKGLATLGKIRKLRISVEAKARAEKIAKGIEDLVLNKLLKII